MAWYPYPSTEEPALLQEVASSGSMSPLLGILAKVTHNWLLWASRNPSFLDFLEIPGAMDVNSFSWPSGFLSLVSSTADHYPPNPYLSSLPTQFPLPLPPSASYDYFIPCMMLLSVLCISDIFIPSYSKKYNEMIVLVFSKIFTGLKPPASDLYMRLDIFGVLTFSIKIFLICQ